jgi:hypothetical protein
MFALCAQGRPIGLAAQAYRIIFARRLSVVILFNQHPAVKPAWLTSL